MLLASLDFCSTNESNCSVDTLTDSYLLVIWATLFVLFNALNSPSKHKWFDLTGTI